MSNAVANLLASRFIARKDVKAVQKSDGSWTPDEKRNSTGAVVERYGWNRASLTSHIAGDASFGHYLLNEDSQCKLFAFDIDLRKTGMLPNCGPEHAANPDADMDFQPVEDLRGAWLDRKHIARWWMKTQFKEMAQMLAAAIHEELALPTAVAYSGGKGVHVYGFTGLCPADQVREGAQIVLDSIGQFEAERGKHFFKHAQDDPFHGFPNLSIEVFPKQTSLDGKDLGNLMRLPLGRNKKSTDPTFFVDMTTPLGDMVPVDPEWALTTDNPWKRPGE